MIDNVGHRLAVVPDSPPLTTVTVVGPTILVPDEDQRWSFEFKNASKDDDEEWLKELQTTVDAYSAPAVVNSETVLLSPPSGTFARFYALVLPEQNPNWSCSCSSWADHSPASTLLSFLSRTPTFRALVLPKPDTPRLVRSCSFLSRTPTGRALVLLEPTTPRLVRSCPS